METDEASLALVADYSPADISTLSFKSDLDVQGDKRVRMMYSRCVSFESLVAASYSIDKLRPGLAKSH